MNTYEYRDIQTGEIKEVRASMKSPPPEDMTIDGRKCKRVYASGLGIVVRDFAIKPSGRSKLPIARMLPSKHDGIVHTQNTDAGVVRTHDDGTKTDGRGRRIIDSQAAYALAKRSCNAEEE